MRFRNGPEILVAGLDDAERNEKVLGNEFITVFLNEATQFSWDTIQMTATRLAQKTRDPAGYAALPKLILDCNPRGPRHWLHTMVYPPSGSSHRERTRLCPPPGVSSVVRVRQPRTSAGRISEDAGKSPGIMRKRMLEGGCDNEGTVYPEFDDDTHAGAPFPIPAG